MVIHNTAAGGALVPGVEPWNIAGLAAGAVPVVQYTNATTLFVDNHGHLANRSGQAGAGNTHIYTDGIADCSAIAFIEMAPAAAAGAAPINVGIVHFQVLEWAGLNQAGIGGAVAGMALGNCHTVTAFGTMHTTDGDYVNHILPWLSGAGGLGVPAAQCHLIFDQTMMVSSLAVDVATGAVGRANAPAPVVIADGGNGGGGCGGCKCTIM